MTVAGIDVGSRSSKALIFQNGQIRGWKIIPTSTDSAESAESIMKLVLKDCSLNLDDVSYVVATGYGRINVPFAQATVTELSCHAWGSYWFFPHVHTVLDMGGQDCKAIRCQDKGSLTNFIVNDKCAAGTGRYLERVASTLNLKLKEIGSLSLLPVHENLEINATCAVYAESDILRLKREGAHINDILAGVHDAIVKKICSLLEKLEVEKEFCITGGIAKNIGIVSRLEERLGLKILIPPEPQIIGALGAALFARDRESGSGV
jgi:predicted CoA-substrate-specific enzyme activase